MATDICPTCSNSKNLRKIEIGAVTVYLYESEEAIGFLEKLLRPMNNQEIAATLGINERTVIRWKQSSRLPTRGNNQIFFIDLIRHVSTGDINAKG